MPKYSFHPRRLPICLQPRLYERLLVASNSKNPPVPLSKIAHDAFAKFLTEDDRYFPMTNRHLSNVAKEAKLIHDEFKFISELFAHFLEYYFQLWPKISDANRSEMLYRSWAVCCQFIDGWADKLKKPRSLSNFTRQNIEPFMSDYLKDPSFSKIHKKANKQRRKELEKYLRSTPQG